MLFFVSPQTDIRQLDQWNKQSKITKSLDKNEWLQASYNNNFKLFNISKELADYIEQVPPLISPMLKIQKLGNVDILANQKIRNIATEQVLIYFSENEDQKKAFILGEGIWKWKMYDFQINGNFSNFSEIFEKTVQYLCIETPKNNLLVDIKNQYLETESIRIKAQYYNKSLELNLDQNLNFEYSNSEGQSFSKPMQIENNQYQIDLPYLGKGIYSYNIKSGKDSSKVLSSGSFSVLPSQLELLDTKARHTLLSKISEQTQGKFYSEADWFKLIEEIKNHPKFKTKSYTSYLLEEWINFRWILWIIMLLISLEWFLRKYLGSI
jgi:hypothetical protein